MANCLGLARSDNSTPTLNSTNAATQPLTGGAMTNQVERGMLAAILVFMGAIGWVGLNM